MKKILFSILLFIPVLAFAQNTVTVPGGSLPVIAQSWRVTGTPTDSINKRYFMTFSGGSWNEIYTATYISKNFIRKGSEDSVVFSNQFKKSSGVVIINTDTIGAGRQYHISLDSATGNIRLDTSQWASTNVYTNDGTILAKRTLNTAGFIFHITSNAGGGVTASNDATFGRGGFQSIAHDSSIPSQTTNLFAGQSGGYFALRDGVGNSSLVGTLVGGGGSPLFPEVSLTNASSQQTGLLISLSAGLVLKDAILTHGPVNFADYSAYEITTDNALMSRKAVRTYGNTLWVATGTGITYANFIFNETPSGTINGINSSFGLANTPQTGKVMVFKNGQLLNPTTDYTISGTTISMIIPPVTGSYLNVAYLK